MPRTPVADPTTPRVDVDVVVLASGAAVPASLLHDVGDAIDAAAFSVAADGGLSHAQRAGRDVDVVVGDLDSVDPEALARARAAGTEILAHPTDKDMTDLDLALELVEQRWTGMTPPRVLIVGGHGGRTDHLLGNLLLIAADRYASLRITMWSGVEVVTVVRGPVEVRRSAGPVLSLLAVHGPAVGVTTTGMRFPLDGATLAPGASLGLSNEIVAEIAQIDVRSGVALAIQSSPVPPRQER